MKITKKMSEYRCRKWTRTVSLLLLSLIVGLMLFAGCTSGGQDADKPSDHTRQTTAAWTDEQTEEPTEELTEELTEPSSEETQTNTDISIEVEEDGWYSTKDEVALYLHLYGHLPDNYITKNEARDLGWDNSLGNLWEVADGMSIGGDKFGNYEGLLPDVPGRQWRECDIGYEGGYRGAERILYSNDGLIYYTDDHYKTFTCIYGEE